MWTTERRVLRSFIALNRRISLALDPMVAPPEWLVDGNASFARDLLPRHLRPNIAILDVGGGKHPCVTSEMALRSDVRLVGLDIDAAELEQAPPGAYDYAIVADLTQYRGAPEFDLVVCRAVMEHVTDAQGALHAIASVLKPGGEALVFLPSSQALFAKLNRAIPQRLKESLLYSVYPEMRSIAGFPAHYNRATLPQYRSMCCEAGLQIVQSRRYFSSRYFHAFIPAWVLWRLYLAARYIADRDNFCETFAVTLRKL
jgi:SAM-dependent methyltransferase